jgi:hypothetical protein
LLQINFLDKKTSSEELLPPSKPFAFNYREENILASEELLRPFSPDTPCRASDFDIFTTHAYNF